MTAAQITMERDAGTEADLDAQSPAADLVRVYLNGIGRTALLSAQQEVELAKRIEAGVYSPVTCLTPPRGCHLPGGPT
jgi:RNA polymerase nonessential primary-like sigma factor